MPGEEENPTKQTNKKPDKQQKTPNPSKQIKNKQTKPNKKNQMQANKNPQTFKIALTMVNTLAFIKWF